MNGSLLAVLGIVVLLVIVLILKMRTGQLKSEVQPESEQEVLDEAKETIAVDAVEELAEQEQGAIEEIAPVAEKLPDSFVETAPPEEDEPEFLQEEKEEIEPAVEPVAVVVSEQKTVVVEEILVAEEVVAAEEGPDAPPITAEEPTVPEEQIPEAEIEELVESIGETASEEVSQAPLVGEEELIEEEGAVTPATASEEPVSVAPSVAELSDETVVMPELVTPVKPTETALLLVRLSMEEYGERLNMLEEQQRAALAKAIELNDAHLRDQLQRELVVMNDRLALLADHYVEEMARYQQVLDTLARLQAEKPSSALAEAISGLQSGKTEAAAEFLEELSGQSHPLAVLAAFLCGQLAESQVNLRKAMEYYRLAVERDPSNPQYLRAAGLMARGMYKYKEALPWLESYVELIKAGGQADAKTVALAQRELAYTYVLSGQYQKAGPLYKESMTVLAQKLGQEHPEMAVSWQQIGEFQETMGEYDKAVSLYKKALAILEKKRGPEHPALAAILRKLAALCVELELEPEAVPLYEKLVRIQEKALRPTHPQLVISLNNLAEAYRLRGRYAEAEACYLKTLHINVELNGDEHPGVAAILQELAKLCTSQRKTDEAKQYQERASAIFQKSVEAEENKAGAEESLTLELS
ncbi:MAG: tetratricopeptide repeat protein [Desulfobulbus sp.]|nr:tetratricopeptide repeat protein [Desulfobulbus sp.]